MPSEKRARQRAMREVRHAEAAKGQLRRRRMRRTFGALLIVGLVVGAVALFSSSSPPKKTAGTTSATKAIAPTCPSPNGSAARHLTFTSAPPVCIDRSATYLATVKTDVGSFTITMSAAASPAAVNSFVFLARYHYYDGTKFFRVIPHGFFQGGDAIHNNGEGTPGYSFTGNTPTGCGTNCYPIGSVSMANSTGPSTNGSQFFVVSGTNETSFAPNYTRFGRVTSGLSVVDAIVAGGNAANAYAPKHVHHIVKVTITEKS